MNEVRKESLALALDLIGKKPDLITGHKGNFETGKPAETAAENVLSVARAFETYLAGKDS